MPHGNKTIADRNQYVVKANDLIRKTRYNLTTQQQKIVLFAVSKIKPNDTSDTVYEIGLTELAAACGLKIDNGGYYYWALKDDIKELTQRSWCVMPDGTESTVSWIGDAEISPGTATVKIKFHKQMAPFLFELREKYTQYKLQNVLAFKGKYTIRLYEILRSHITQKMLDEGRESDIMMPIESLRDTLMVSSYPRWADFDRFIIRKSVMEINQYADDIHVDYRPIKKGKSIASVNFVISQAGIRQQWEAHQGSRERLNR